MKQTIYIRGNEIKGKQIKALEALGYKVIFTICGGTVTPQTKGGK